MNEAFPLMLALAAFGYFLPTLVAGIRGVPNKGSVVVLNIFLGWTLLGWVLSLAMACRSPQPTITASER
jgi:hypothetical protein